MTVHVPRVRRAIVAGAMAMLVACGGHAPPIQVPTRATTAGDALLSRLPAGAAIVLEIDVARLRANPTLGPLVTDVLAPLPAGADASAATAGAAADRAAALTAMTDAPLASARALVLAAYAVGTPQATTITIVDGDAAPPQATPLGPTIYALAAEGDVARVLAVAQGGPSLAEDRALLALRALAMPAAADGASARLTARLDGPARKALADLLGTADAPAAISAWLDVADDLALIAWLGGDPRRHALLLTRLRDRAAALPAVAALGLAPAIGAATIRRERGAARLTFVVAPARLGRVVVRARAGLAPPVGTTASGRVESPR